MIWLLMKFISLFHKRSTEVGPLVLVCFFHGHEMPRLYLPIALHMQHISACYKMLHKWFQITAPAPFFPTGYFHCIFPDGMHSMSAFQAISRQKKTRIMDFLPFKEASWKTYAFSIVLLGRIQSQNCSEQSRN